MCQSVRRACFDSETAVGMYRARAPVKAQPAPPAMQVQRAEGKQAAQQQAAK